MNLGVTIAIVIYLSINAIIIAKILNITKILNININLSIIISSFIIAFLLLATFTLDKKQQDKLFHKKLIIEKVQNKCDIKKLHSKEYKEKRIEVYSVLGIITLLIGVIITILISIMDKGSYSSFALGLGIFALILYFFNLYSNDLVNYILCKIIK